MELLEYQIEDIRRALREYVKKFTEVEIDHADEDDPLVKIAWQSGANERAALLELCQQIVNTAVNENMRRLVEGSGGAIYGISE